MSNENNIQEGKSTGYWDNKTKKRGAITLIAVLLFLIIINTASAATYYTNQSSAGVDTGADCANAKSLLWFNANGVAGDTCIMCDGTYATLIAPINSGISGNTITYIADNQWAAVLSTSSYGYYLYNVNYITIDGLYFNDIGSYFGYVYNAEYCIIQNNKFYDSPSYGGTFVGYSSNYNQFLNNIFEDAPVYPSGTYWDAECTAAWNAGTTLPNDCDRGTAPEDFLSIYSGLGNIIENNTFGNASHGSINIESRPYSPWGDSISTLTVVRDNNFLSKFHSSCGTGVERVLIDDNIVSGAGSRYDRNPRKASRDRGLTGGHGAVYVLNHDSIVKRNTIDDCGWGLYYGATGSGAHISDNLKIFQNTFFDNVYHVQQSGNSGANYNNNTLKNNIFNVAQYREWSDYADLDNNDENYIINNAFTPGAENYYFKNINTIARNLTTLKTLYPLEWFSSNFEATPQFADATNKDFTLNASSPMIDTGAHLTTISSATNTGQTTIIVDDAGYFYDGWSIPGEVGDTIKTAGGEETVIQSINYATNTLTVSPAIDIVNGEGLSLTYNGSAPDIGAFESSGDSVSNITSWQNNDTSDSSLDITIDLNQDVRFNATANQTIITWAWKQDGIDQSINYDNATLSWSTHGTKTVTVTATNPNGTSNAVTWNVTVECITPYWFDGDFAKRINLTIDHSLVNGAQTNHPVYINITDSNLSVSAQADGDDIIFVDLCTMTQIDYHKERPYSSATGYLEAWVNIPYLYDDSNTTIQMYFGDADAVNTENKTAVWLGFAAAYLFAEDSGSYVNDSTGNNRNGTGTNLAWGRLGLDLPGSNEHVSIPNFIGQDDDWTILSRFIQDTRNPYGQGHDSAIMSYTDGTGSTGRTSLFINDYGTPSYTLSTYIDGSNNDANTIISTADTHSIAFSQSGTSFNFYLNGSSDGSFTSTADPADGNIILFDRKTAAGDACFEGTFDYLLWYTGAMEHNTIETIHNNTNSPNTFIIVSSEDTLNYPPLITSYSNNVTNNDSLVFTINTSEYIKFNATTNQSIISWDWRNGGIQQSNNYDNITFVWFTNGTRIITINGTNNNGTSNSITWNVNVINASTGDVTAPTYNNIGYSATEAGQSCTFSIKYNDDIGLEFGKYIFATNNSGIWVNDTAINWSVTPQYANVTKTLNSTHNTVVGYRWYANDSTGNDNNTPIYTLTVQDTTPPASITGLTSSTTNLNHNWTWTNPMDTDFNYTHIYMNGIWVVNQSLEYYNVSASAHNTSNISIKTVDTTGNLGTWVNHTSNIPNNLVTILNGTLAYTINEGENIYVDFDSTDLDTDTPTFYCNDSNFADFNTLTGTGNWLTSQTSSGTHYIGFGVSDGHGSESNYTVTVTIREASPSSLYVSSTTSNSLTWGWGNPHTFDTVMVYLNDEFQSNTTTGSYAAESLTSSTSYTIKLIAVYNNIQSNSITSTDTTSSSSSSSGSSSSSVLSQATATPIPLSSDTMMLELENINTWDKIKAFFTGNPISFTKMHFGSATPTYTKTLYNEDAVSCNIPSGSTIKSCIIEDGYITLEIEPDNTKFWNEYDESITLINKEGAEYRADFKVTVINIG